MSTIFEDEIDEELGEVPATLSEEQENLVQMQEIADRTVEPGLVRFPPPSVTTAANSPQYAIDVEHPITGDLRVFAEKPVHGWSDDHGIAQILKWYGIRDSDPYKLQTCEIYMQHTGDAAEQPHGWEIVKPPDYEPPLREQYRHWRRSIALERFQPGPRFAMWAMLAFAAAWIPFITSVLVGTVGVGVGTASVAGFAWFCIWTVIGMSGGLHE